MYSCWESALSDQILIVFMAGVVRDGLTFPGEGGAPLCRVALGWNIQNLLCSLSGSPDGALYNSLRSSEAQS